MSKYLLNVSAGEYGELDAAIAEVTEELLKTIEARRRVFNLAKQEDSNLYSLRYWCDAVDLFRSEDGVECTELSLRRPFFDSIGDVWLVPDDFGYTAERIECLTMVVTEDGVHWTCYQKHCDIEHRTDELRYDELKAS